MDENYKDLEIKLESAYYNRNKVGTRVDKVDLVDAAKVIEEDVLSKVGTGTSTDKIVITQTISELQSLAIDKKVAYCNESAMLYRYNSDISDYLENDNTVVTSSISGGWIEYDSYSKLFKSSSTIILDHLNQSSTVMLSADTDFIAKVDTIVNNGHTHVCKLFCNGFTPTFSGFTFMSDSSPLDVLTLDTTIGYYYTIIFFKIAGDNKYIILEKVLSTDVTPPTLSVPYTSTDGLIIELPFSRAMANPAAQAGLFSVSGSRSVVSAALKSGDATKIQVTVDNAYTDSDIITISITSGLVPADNEVVFAGVTNQSVTNNVRASLTYPTGYVALHSADQSIVDLSAKTVSDLSDNNRGLSLFAETTPASDGGVLANGNKSILFPAGTAFKFPSFVCNNVNGFAFACVFTFEDTNSTCGFANSPHNWCGKLGANVHMSSGSKLSTIAAPSSKPIVAFVVGLENNSDVIKVKQYAYNLTTNNIITNDVGTAVTFSSITKDFGIGEINYNGAVNYAGATKWQHSIFYERSLNDTEFSALCAKIVNDYKV